MSSAGGCFRCKKCVRRRRRRGGRDFEFYFILVHKNALSIALVGDQKHIFVNRIGVKNICFGRRIVASSTILADFVETSNVC